LDNCFRGPDILSIRPTTAAVWKVCMSAYLVSAINFSFRFVMSYQ
jgi:hypothetical protein